MGLSQSNRPSSNNDYLAYSLPISHEDQAHASLTETLRDKPTHQI